jgi:2-polyprenyl-3-methyl-5-hydroxy-6-metoxy-1,4-benzoquinol methylase/predicted RNA-binding Zn-ribbon protein involved in translation (DUF1610 family)
MRADPYIPEYGEVLRKEWDLIPQSSTIIDLSQTVMTIRIRGAMNQTLEITPCPACGNRIFRKRFTKKGCDFWQCETCGLEKIYPLPTLEELKAYYDSSYSDGMYKTFVDAGQMKYMTAEERYKAIKSYCLPGRWLDVGCSNGTFVKIARQNGQNAEGIDLSDVAVERGRAEGLPLFSSTIEDFAPDYRYQSISGFDVLEHVLDPVGFLESVHRLLEPGGTVAVSVPNRGSLICKIMRKNWYFYIPEEHMHYFDPSSMTRLLKSTGFNVRHVRRAYKPLTYNYSLTQFIEYNPTIFKILNTAAKVIPNRLRNAIVPLYIGEMIVFAESQPN